MPGRRSGADQDRAQRVHHHEPAAAPRVGSALGFDLAFVIDATATTPLPHWRTGVVLGTDEIIERTEYALAERFATIATVDELTGVRAR